MQMERWFTLSGKIQYFDMINTLATLPVLKLVVVTTLFNDVWPRLYQMLLMATGMSCTALLTPTASSTAYFIGSKHVSSASDPKTTT